MKKENVHKNVEIADSQNEIPTNCQVFKNLELNTPKFNVSEVSTPGMNLNRKAKLKNANKM